MRGTMWRQSTSVPTPSSDVLHRLSLVGLGLAAKGDEYSAKSVSDGIATIERLSAERLQLREALGPFAAEADRKESGYTFDVPDTVYCDVTLGDCRKARTALSNTAEDTP